MAKKKLAKAAAKVKVKPKPKAKPAPAKKPAPKPAAKARPAPAPAAARAGHAPAPKGAPAGQHSVTPHLIVRNSAQAIDFYKKAFGAVEVMRMPGPDGFSTGHVEIKIGDSHVYMADEFPQWGSKAPSTLGGT